MAGMTISAMMAKTSTAVLALGPTTLSYQAIPCKLLLLDMKVSMC